MPRAEVDLAWKTQAGHRHQVEGRENEDAVFVTNQHPLFDAVLMVADGMGGHPRPREASEVAVRRARELLFDLNQLERSGGVREALSSAIGMAHRAVCSLRAATSGSPGGYGSASAKAPGTTLSIVVVADGMLYVAHVGDGSVFLMREGQIHVVAGGEERRVGNRPAQFLGQEDLPEIETRRAPLAAGDRLLLCTDGLTRYFRDAGPEALERVLGRRAVEMQSIAAQLTAHSRPDGYDDDTTVAVAEVLELVEVPVPPPAPAPVPERTTASAAAASLPPAYIPTSEKATTRGGLSLPAILASAVAGAALLAGGFFAGRMTAPTSTQKGAGEAGNGSAREPVSPEALRKLPPGNVVLVDKLRNTVYLLSTRATPPASGPTQLQALRMGTDGRVESAGRFTLDATRGELTDADGNVYPVDTDFSTGAIRVLRGGKLSVTTRPSGATVFVDGKRVGNSPLRLTLAAGRHEVRVEGKDWNDETGVEVIPNRSVSVVLEPR